MRYIVYRGSHTHYPDQIRCLPLYRTWAAIYGEIIRLISNDVEYQATKLRAILAKPKPIPIPQIVPNLVIPDLAIPDVPSIIDDTLVPEDDPEDDEEPEMDPNEPEQIDEDDMEDDDLEDDIDTIVPKDDIEEEHAVEGIVEIVLGPHAEIAQIAVIWTIEIAA